MTEHSREPWNAVLNKHPEGAAAPDNWIIGDVNHRTIAACPLAYRDTEADAKRIVACVNACRGVETEILVKADKFVNSCLMIGVANCMEFERDNTGAIDD